MKEVLIRWDRNKLMGYLPESFKEMTPAQFLAVVSYRCSLLDCHELVRKVVFKTKRHRIPLWTCEVIRQYMEYVNQLNEPLDHFIMPCIDTGLIRKIKYYAPNDKLTGMSLQQFMSIDNFFQFYTSTQKKEFLYKMVACMYLRKEKSYFGNNLLDIEKEAENMSKIDPIVNLACYLNWILVKNWLSKTFKVLFSGGESKSKGTDWLVVFDSFVGDHIADMEAYQRMECMDAFRIMNNKIKESRKHE